MLRINKLADYAVLILNCLSIHFGKRLSAKEVAKVTYISLPTVSKILKILLDAKLVLSTRGAIGGYSLALLPNKITLAQIITAMEGQPALTECSLSKKRCAQDPTCAVKHNWKTINQFILNTLENITLADMSHSFNLEDLILKFTQHDQCRRTNVTI